MKLHIQLTRFGSLILVVALGATLVGVVLAQAVFSVKPVVETATTGSGGSGDISDDPAIWLHPTNPQLSTIIGTDKSAAGGLNVYALNGSVLQFADDGMMNNVDLRYRFPLGNDFVDIVVATHIITPNVGGELAIYTVNPTTRLLTNVTGNTAIPFEPYGIALYHSPISGKFYAFVSTEDSLAVSHRVVQYELVDGGNGRINSVARRTLANVIRTEGMVVDDVTAAVYLGVEARGLFRYDAEPSGGTISETVDLVGGANGLPGDIEGVTLYPAGSTAGYLLLSSQGSSDYWVYERMGDHRYVTNFNIVTNGGIDGTNETDGIDVINTNLGSPFSTGLFVAHDGINSGGTTSNFKYVPWGSVVAAAPAPLSLLTDTNWNPRLSPEIGVGDIAASEGETAVFTLTLTHPMSYPLTVDYTTAPGSAQPAIDFNATSGTATFAAGALTTQVSVSLIENSKDEPNRSFTLQLSDPSFGTVQDASAAAQIQDDDPPPTISISSNEIAEGNSGSQMLPFVVTLSAASGYTVSAQFATSNLSAVAGSDYGAVSGTVTFAPGETSQTIDVPVYGDTAVESNQQFRVSLSNLNHAVAGMLTAVGTIVDDDSAPPTNYDMYLPMTVRP